ncbi:DUF116 domain-containing protein [Caldalkalibacillus salinus]|uniref:DUF116 domain-containing protein n=1 Tax=Caldalkalibacillus salinus TaxID=2803787 RepID=UPI00192075B1|nr:DUF116 domain-containing protein [Caldalkalibacillus salinus]
MGDHNKAERPQLDRPRKLGGDYEGWDGNLEENNGDLDTSPWLFLSLSALTVLAIFISVFVFLYMIQPRLEGIHPYMYSTVKWAFVLLSVTVIGGYMCIMLTVQTEKPFAFFLKRKEVANNPLVPVTFMIGKRLGFSKDRLKNSLLKISNAVNRSLYPKVHPDDLLILVPRCLSQIMRKELKDLTERYGVKFHTASGGNKARELLVTEQPRAVIGVACERDLFSGMQDVDGQMPVLTIANKRPDGPCFNTYINLQEMEEAISFFLGHEQTVPDHLKSLEPS